MSVFGASDRLDMLSVDNHDFDMALQQIGDRFPQHPRRLQSHMGDALSFEPVAHDQHISRHGTESVALLVEPASGFQRVGASLDRSLVDIETCTAFRDDLQRAARFHKK